MKTVTLRWAALLALALSAPAALAQNDTLGDEFIFFVDGTNVLVPNVDGGTTVTDPLEAGNKVARFAPGAWTEGGFSFGRNVGIDATANVGATYGESDTLYFRLLSDVANASLTGISIMLTDATDDVSIDRATAEAMGEDFPDYLMRLVWTIPAEFHDGQWHELAIPLPPATYDALEAARAAGDLMDGAENWAYAGAWSLGGFGIGGVGGVDPPTSDPLFREFGWNQIYRLGPFWDNGEGATGGPIFLDDVYIGGPSTTTDGATALPTAMSGVTFAADDTVNKVSWNEIDGAGGYNIYASLEPITDVTAEGVIQLARRALGAPTELIHRFENPHPGLGAPQIYYAVTSLSLFGVENQDVSSSSGAIVNSTIAQRPYIREITTAEADALFDELSNGAPTGAGFPDDQPTFILDSGHRTVTEFVDNPPQDADNSAMVQVGYTQDNEWFIYGEVTDDQPTFAPGTGDPSAPGTSGGDTYLYDSIELEIGHYEVRTTDGGGDLLLGSPHMSMQRGDEPDYQIRIAARQNANGDIVSTSTFVSYVSSATPIEFPSASVVTKTATGWKFVSLIPMNQIQVSGDVVLPPPASDEIQFIPFSIGLNDADGGQREHQIVDSVKPNVTNQWYQTPAQWQVASIAGRQFASDVETGIERDGFSLDQTVPNPTTGTATLAFSLGAPSQATVEVFNALGQRVMTVAQGELASGPHSLTVDTSGLASGVYLYRLSAGTYTAARRMTVIR